ncbi:MAG: ArsR/SmtB family transcription factor [Tepidisphaeraceae bacterium]
MRDFLAITAALSDENRVRALLALRGGELCVCQIIELLGLAPSTVSKHVSLLRQAGLVDSRKDGRWMYYRLAGDDAPPTVREALRFTLDVAPHSPRAREDARRLSAILKENPEDLCRRQAGRPECCSSAPETPVALRWPRGGRAISAPTRSRPTPPARARTGSTRSR